MDGVVKGDRVSAATMAAVMVAAVGVYDREGRATVRQVAGAAGVGVFQTHRALRALRGLGLVDWADGCRGSLRPTVGVRVVT